MNKNALKIFSSVIICVGGLAACGNAVPRSVAYQGVPVAEPRGSINQQYYHGSDPPGQRLGRGAP